VKHTNGLKLDRSDGSWNLQCSKEAEIDIVVYVEHGMGKVSDYEIIIATCTSVQLSDHCFF
jgi:hypothetical protein